VAPAATGTHAHAAVIAGVHRSVLYTRQWRNDLAFQAVLKQAEQAAADLIEWEAYRWAIEGVEKPVG
jgi:hypothetical protein